MQLISYVQSGRFITGIGVGILCMIVPLYQAELAHPSIRGRVTSLQQFMLGIGALSASWIGYGWYVICDLLFLNSIYLISRRNAAIKALTEMIPGNGASHSVFKMFRPSSLDA